MLRLSPFTRSIMLALLLKRLPSLLPVLVLLFAEEGVPSCLSDVGVDVTPSG